MVKSYIPTSLEEALQLMNQIDTVPFAGGTDLMIQNRTAAETPRKFSKPVLFLSKINELSYIRKGEAHLYIGASTPLSTILKHQDTPLLLKKAIKEMASPAIRNMGTLAGNIGNASPAADSLPVLYVLNALVKVQSLNASKLYPISDFITGVKQTLRNHNELITEIIIPLTSFSGIYYKKVGSRKADAISKVSFAGAWTLINEKILDFRIAIGSVSPTVVRRFDIESKYIGLSKTDILKQIEDILKSYESTIRPITDQRSSKEYRFQISLNILKDFINEVAK